MMWEDKDDQQYDPETDCFTINYDKLAESKELLAVTRLLASSMMKNPYCRPKDFFESVSDDDLKLLVEVSEQQDHKNFGDLILLAEMLATGEGLPPGTFEDNFKRVKQFVVFCAAESLYRKNLIRLYRENMSFGDDMGSKVVMERL